jgi:uncharacterized membrane protein YfcA
MPWPWLLIAFAIFLIGLSKSGLGAGLGLIVVPMVAIGLANTPLGSQAALGLLLPLLIAGDIFSIVQHRKSFNYALIRKLVLPTILGILAGSAVLWIIHAQDQRLVEILIRLEIGLESIFLVTLTWWRNFRGIQQKLLPEPSRSWITGLFTGVSTTLAHAAGPIVANYLLPLKPDRRSFVGTTAVFFFFANSTKLLPYALAGQFNHVDLTLVLILLPLVALGALCGLWIVKRITDQSFFRFVYLAVFFIGIYLVAESGFRLHQFFTSPMT